MPEVVEHHAEPLVSTEQERLQHFVTKATAQIIASTFDSSALTAEHTIGQEKAADLRTHIIQSTPDMISYAALDAHSTLSRKQYWEGSTKSFAEQNELWNAHTWNWMNKNTSEENPASETVKEALASLDLHPENSTKAGALYEEVENFRKEYLKGKSKVEKLVQKLADGCKDDRGTVNLEKLEKRASSISELLRIYGTDADTIPALIKDYAQVNALLSQPEAVKQQIADIVIPVVTAENHEDESQHYVFTLGTLAQMIRESGNTVWENLRRPFRQTTTETPGHATTEHAVIQAPVEPVAGTNQPTEESDAAGASIQQASSGGRGDNDPTTNEALMGGGTGSEPSGDLSHGDSDPTTNEAAMDVSDGGDDGDSDAGDDPGGSE